ncbi:MAG: alpha/beta fold hydrolase [Pseudomonadota bacterium]
MPERRDDPQSPTITVPIAYISAPDQANKAEDPFLFLMGGTGSGFSVLPLLSPLPAVMNRDVIVVEQRGNPMATPAYTCPSVPQAIPLHRLYNSAVHFDGQPSVDACKADLLAKGMDLEAYTTPFAADDLIDLRKALGLDSWNVYGVSYGGRVGTTLLRKDPAAIRSLIIDSSQVTGTWFSSWERLKAVGDFFDRCAAAPQCGSLYPNLRETYQATIDALIDQPVAISRNGTPDTLTAYGYMHLVDWSLYQLGLDQMTRLPEAIEAAGRGDFNSLLAINSIYGEYAPKWQPTVPGYTPDSRSNAQQVAMLCLEEFPFNRSVDEPSLAQKAGWSDNIVNLLADTEKREREVCELWGFGQDDPLQAQAPTGDRPTLILTAEHDTISPPAHSATAAQSLSNSQLVIFPWTAHGVIAERQPCGFLLMRTFIENPGGPLDTSCVAAIDEPVWVPEAAGIGGDEPLGLVRTHAANSVEKYGFPARAVHVIAPQINVAGQVYVDGRLVPSARPTTGDEPFRIASQTKTFTAAAALRLVEDGKVNLDGPIEPYLSDLTISVLRQGGYDPQLITLRQLLNHTSGMPDYAMDRAYIQEALGNPLRQWTRDEQIAWGTNRMAKLGQPGEAYHYSDTGYVIAGEIIERQSGMDQAPAFRELLKFSKLGLDETWFETLEDVPEAAGVRARQYANGQDVTDANPSFDLYGGGGLVSTHEDLSAFYRALFEGNVFDNDETLTLMLEIADTNRQPSGDGYGLGIVRATIDGVVCWGHAGFFGSSTFHCPDADLTVTSNRYTADSPPTYDGAGVLKSAILMQRLRIEPADPN